MVLGLKPLGKPATSDKKLSVRQNLGIAWSKGLRPTEKPFPHELPSARKNQGLAWSSDSNLWGN